mgnify:CR=1 FL=1
MINKDKLKGCLVLGAIGDAAGGEFEGSLANSITDLSSEWNISDDTQLTVATCESIIKNKGIPLK